jgi:hypothetical protein
MSNENQKPNQGGQNQQTQQPGQGGQQQGGAAPKPGQQSQQPGQGGQQGSEHKEGQKDQSK